MLAPMTAAHARIALGLHASLSALLALIVVVVWAAADGDGLFWPAWVFVGLFVPLAIHAGARWAEGLPTRGERALGVCASVAGALAVADVAAWAIGGAGEFWPVWPLSALAVWIAVQALVVHRHRLFGSAREEELSERVDELARTRRSVVDAQAAELRRIERDLHDGAQARLVALTMHLGRAEERLGDRPEAAELVRRAREEATAAIGELRDLARGIAPPVLADRGLMAAVEALGRRSAIPVSVEGGLSRRPAPVVETAAYFVVAEALTNVAKHAPQAAALVTLAERGDLLVVEVADDGPGGADPAGAGLTGLRHRVEAVDGRLEIASEPGSGTLVRVELPCGS
ncbi:MAG: histidine kinase [Solirubrobacteraceae bacterium]|nr:histidine kinase [Solirubrobacteraceae bacterium]